MYAINAELACVQCATHPPPLQATVRPTRVGGWPTHSAFKAPATALTPPAPPPWSPLTMRTEVGGCSCCLPSCLKCCLKCCLQHCACCEPCPQAPLRQCSFTVLHLPPEPCAGILGGEAAAAVAAGINVMVWHETTVGICQLQASAWPAAALLNCCTDAVGICLLPAVQLTRLMCSWLLTNK